MAIQIPNPGTGNGATGDNEFVLWSKVKDNFSDQTNAASKLLGDGAEQVPLGKHVSDLTYSTGTGSVAITQSIADAPYGKRRATGSPDMPVGHGSNSNITTQNSSNSTAWQLASPYATGGNLFYIRAKTYNGAYGAWGQIYTSNNTTKDTATGFLKASSPVLHVYNDKIDKIHEAEQLDITVDKKGVGHYEIHGTTGLRKNDGWFMSPPRDVHGNVLCMVDLDEKDGVVILRTYKKKFDFETVSIVHDYDNPTDIPEGVCVEFRFNDLPQEQLDEPIE